MDIDNIISVLHKEYNIAFNIDDLIGDIEATAWEVAYLLNKHLPTNSKQQYEAFESSFKKDYRNVCKVLDQFQ